MSESLEVDHVATLFRHASMSTTYKPALLKALVYACIRYETTDTIPLSYLGHEFARMYWNQTIVFHLRQAAVLTKEAEAVRRVRAVAEKYGVRAFSDLPSAGVDQIERSMAKVLAINVLERFHASKPPGMLPLFRWKPGDETIRIPSYAREFLRQNVVTMMLIANHHWAYYLESSNRLAPRIIEKVTRDGAQRESIARYLRILLDDDGGSCFYCDRPFTTENRPVIDHVIPWSFLLEDPLWDLVPACFSCNSAKSDWLPERGFIDRLTVRNTRDLKARVGTRVGLLVGSDDLERAFNSAIAVEWPRFWTPA